MKRKTVCFVEKEEPYKKRADNIHYIAERKRFWVKKKYCRDPKKGMKTIPHSAVRGNICIPVYHFD